MRAAPEDTQLDVGCEDEAHTTSTKASRKRTASLSEVTITVLPGPSEEQYFKNSYAAERVETLTKYISNPALYDLSETDIAMRGNIYNLHKKCLG
jgi:hypothetical protein